METVLGLDALGVEAPVLHEGEPAHAPA
jgi:hypothetical protein